MLQCCESSLALELCSVLEQPNECKRCGGVEHVSQRRQIDHCRRLRAVTEILCFPSALRPLATIAVGTVCWRPPGRRKKHTKTPTQEAYRHQPTGPRPLDAHDATTSMAEGTGSLADKSTDDDRIRIPTSGPDVVACRPLFLFDNRVNFTDATLTKIASPVWIFRCFESKYNRRAGSKVLEEGKYLAGTRICEKKPVVHRRPFSSTNSTVHLSTSPTKGRKTNSRNSAW